MTAASEYVRRFANMNSGTFEEVVARAQAYYAFLTESK